MCEFYVTNEKALKCKKSIKLAEIEHPKDSVKKMNGKECCAVLKNHQRVQDDGRIMNLR